VQAEEAGSTLKTLFTHMGMRGAQDGIPPSRAASAEGDNRDKDSNNGEPSSNGQEESNPYGMSPSGAQLKGVDGNGEGSGESRADPLPWIDEIILRDTAYANRMKQAMSSQSDRGAVKDESKDGAPEAKAQIMRINFKVKLGGVMVVTDHPHYEKAGEEAESFQLHFGSLHSGHGVLEDYLGGGDALDSGGTGHESEANDSGDKSEEERDGASDNGDSVASLDHLGIEQHNEIRETMLKLVAGLVLPPKVQQQWQQ